MPSINHAPSFDPDGDPIRLEADQAAKDSFTFRANPRGGITMTLTKEKKAIPTREIFINIEGQIIYNNEIQGMSDQELQRLHSWLIAEEIMLTSAKEEWTGGMPGYDMKKGISFAVKLNATKQFLALVSAEINVRRGIQAKTKEKPDQRISEFLKVLEVKFGKEAIDTIWNVVDKRLQMQKPTGSHCHRAGVKFGQKTEV